MNGTRLGKLVLMMVSELAMASAAIPATTAVVRKITEREVREERAITTIDPGPRQRHPRIISMPQTHISECMP
ncbi:unnamed protein product [Gongylonema pulchrum]|uniref:Secreted protein n=1 Tax=Gongylonema pulchrum TaxID=637853 RepID=A0A183E2F1_9BILA|nr:unnamed protein product [Gongylonema pulchrum]